MLRRSLALAVTGMVLGAALALAEPQFAVRYPSGVPQVSISGDYAGSTYTVWRAPAAGGDFEPITENFILCLGSCYAEDRTAAPGGSYLYLFELNIPDGAGARLVRYGPYPATISPAGARPVGVFAYPNPGHGATSIQLHVAGTPADGMVRGEVGIFDLSGRRVRTIQRGEFARGLTTLTWDGRDQRGAVLPPGVYLLRFAAGGDQALARIVRR